MMHSTCWDHRDGKITPLCQNCQRINVERTIVERTVDALLAAGYSLNVDNGGDTAELPTFTQDKAAVLAVMQETDVEHLLTRKSKRDGWVMFVYGNDGWDVISDYTVSLDPIIEPITEYAETLDLRS